MDNNNDTEVACVPANEADQTLNTGQQETWLIMSVQADCSDRGTEAGSVWGCGLAEVVAASRAAALGIRDSSLGGGPEVSGEVCVCRVVVVVGWQLDKHHSFGRWCRGTAPGPYLLPAWYSVLHGNAEDGVGSRGVLVERCCSHHPLLVASLVKPYGLCQNLRQGIFGHRAPKFAMTCLSTTCQEGVEPRLLPDSVYTYAPEQFSAGQSF